MPAAHALKADALMWKAKVLKGGATDFQEAIKSINAVECQWCFLIARLCENIR